MADGGDYDNTLYIIIITSDFKSAFVFNRFYFYLHAYNVKKAGVLTIQTSKHSIL